MLARCFFGVYIVKRFLSVLHWFCWFSFILFICYFGGELMVVGWVLLLVLGVLLFVI